MPESRRGARRTRYAAVSLPSLRTVCAAPARRRERDVPSGRAERRTFIRAFTRRHGARLTRRDVEDTGKPNWGGAIIAVAVFGGLLWAILKAQTLAIAAPPIEPLTVKRVGDVLMTDYVWPLQCVGLLLTAALIGALILVMEEKR